MLLSYKLSLAPILIIAVTWAGRRWGPAVSGLLVGLPLTSGPISWVIAWEQGSAFAAQAAVGSLVGQISVCIFCVTYARCLSFFSPIGSALLASSAFLLATSVWGALNWSFFSASVALVCTVVISLRMIPDAKSPLPTRATPYWDIPVRIAVAMLLLLLLTKLANQLGPVLSGLLAPLPVFTLIFAYFASQQEGAGVARTLLRGVVLSSGAYMLFFIAVGYGLPVLGLWVYPLAGLLAIGFNAVVYHRLSARNGDKI